jgi:hypothetical protein
MIQNIYILYIIINTISMFARGYYKCFMQVWVQYGEW